MLENEEISEDGLQQVMMVLAQMDDGEEGL
jgi:hypothetical protein